MCQPRLTWREVRRALVDLGARPRRPRGSHQRWVLPGGQILVFLLGRDNQIAPCYVVRRLEHLRGRSSEPSPPPVRDPSAA